MPRADLRAARAAALLIAAAGASLVLAGAPARAQEPWTVLPSPSSHDQLDLGAYTVDLNKANAEWTLTNKQTGETTKISGDDGSDDCGSYGGGDASAVSQAYGALASAQPAESGRQGMSPEELGQYLKAMQNVCTWGGSRLVDVGDEALRQREEAVRIKEQELLRLGQELRQLEETLRRREAALDHREAEEHRRDRSREGSGPTFILPIPGFGSGSGHGGGQGSGHGSGQGHGTGQGHGSGQGQGQGQGKNCHTNPATGQLHCE